VLCLPLYRTLLGGSRNYRAWTTTAPIGCQATACSIIRISTRYPYFVVLDFKIGFLPFAIFVLRFSILPDAQTQAPALHDMHQASLDRGLPISFDFCMLGNVLKHSFCQVFAQPNHILSNFDPAIHVPSIKVCFLKWPTPNYGRDYGRGCRGAFPA